MRLSMNKPNSWANINIIGGNANVEKNAVDPAMRNGSFFLNNTTASRKLFTKTNNSLRTDFSPIMIAAKICSTKSRFSSFQNQFDHTQKYFYLLSIFQSLIRHQEVTQNLLLQNQKK